ncbi:MAG: nucleotidyltransferase family protein [Boseongicola sp.]|nr:nucleotidyltransferase family protein [Boseongicola sp.]
MKPLIAIPAAGASTRMGDRDKLLEMVDGIPLLRRQALAAIAVGCPVTVLVRPNDHDRRNALDGLDVDITEVPNAAEGLSATLKAAAQLPSDQQALVILLPDIPGIGTDEIKLVINKFVQSDGTSVVRAVDDQGRPGFPVVVPHELLSTFDDIDGDRGLSVRDYLAVEFADDRVTRDLDAPEDWAKWRGSD